jgi:hypothetical protein
MASTTGIELGPNTCLLAAVRRPRGKRAEVFALARIDADKWSSDPSTLAATLRAIRRTDGFPQRASVVEWFDSDDSSGTPPRRHALSSIETAGFQITSVISPPQALTRLAIECRRGSLSEPIAWMVLNTYGAAIAIVRGGDLLFSRTFPITYKPDLTTSKAQLLQRYLLVSHLAPELSRGFAVVRETHGLPVNLVVTCGDLPDLRSLTMPLIEELDIEVETLDSTDGMQALSRVSISRFEELAPALRLATAATTGDTRSVRRPMFPVLARLAAAVAVVAAVAWLGYAYWRVPKTDPDRQGTTSDRSGSRSSEAHARSAPGVESALPNSGLGQAQAASSGGSRMAPKAQESAPQPVATGGSREPNRAVPTVPNTPPKQSSRVSSDRRTALQTESAAPRLQEPLPRIDTVLIDQSRRLAIANGTVVSVGDTIGSRVVVEIARDGVALREPSGRIVRVRR